MMECDEIIDYIDAAEFALASLRKPWGRKYRASALAVAAFAFAQMQHEAEDMDLVPQIGELIRIALMVDELRKGRDPRCNLCKQNGELKIESRTAVLQ